MTFSAFRILTSPFRLPISDFRLKSGSQREDLRTPRVQIHALHSCRQEDGIFAYVQNRNGRKPGAGVPDCSRPWKRTCSFCTTQS